jgi:diamine N-acetyltransferase
VIERREVTRDNVRALMALEVGAAQRGLVAPNAVTLAQAPYESGARVWGLWDGDVAVGLIAMVHPAEYLWFVEGEDREAAYLWRLMIDESHQGKGYGRAAIAEVAQVARDWGVPRVSAGVVDLPQNPLGFYEKLGFRRTGLVIDGEIMIEKPV